ncbi:filamentous hemagglutinin N-terminal domain-containing protein [Scytonema hofmannii]|nr:filamentous hemagglutinin N-terminal domain-containing protein [Scytonema hofmannii]
MFEGSLSGRWFCRLGIAVWSAIVLSPNCALGQIIPDGTLSNNTIVTPDASTFNITGGTQADGNLFHSFKDFSVPTGGTAFFNNGTEIANIISRVTGGSISNINGLIRSNGTANLFLLNPSGMIFGLNASLNVGGSFLATTANAIQFGERGFFSASNPETPTQLLAINPSALLFNQITAPIQNQSIARAGRDPAGFNAFGLRVPDGKSLLLVGGNISMDGGQLNAYGGRVELGGLATPGTVALSVDGNNLVALGFPTQSTRADVSLTNRAGVYVEAAGGGSIAVNARNIELSGESQLTAGIGQGLGSVGAVAGDITLNATGEIKVVNSALFNVVQTRAVGNGGNINVSTDSLSLTDGAQLFASTYGQGNTGNASVDASGSVSFTNSSAAFSTVESTGVGKGGDIKISAESLSVTNGAQLVANSRGKGDAGNVIIDARGSVFFDGTSSNGKLPSAAFSSVSSTGVGKGGDIKISAGSLSVTNGARLSASTYGQGNAGSVIIDANGKVSFDGTSGDGESPSAAFSTVFSTGVGKGGNIKISAESLSVTNGAQLQANTQGKGDAGSVIIDARSSVSFESRSRNGRFTALSGIGETGVGKAGDIRITTDQLFLTNGAYLSAGTSGKGDGGNVIINARKVSFDSGSSVRNNVEPTGDGKGGNIKITTDELSLTNGAFLSATSAGKGNGGSVIIDARAASFDGIDVFSVVAETGVGKAGDIRITTDELSLTNGAQVLTYTFGKGDGGSVIINARNVSFDGRRDNQLPSGAFSGVGETGVGKAGDIRISTDELFLTSGASLGADTSGKGEGGSIIINARKVSFDSSSVASNIEKTGVGKGGSIRITTDELSVSNNAGLSASTSGKGDGGGVIIDARKVSFNDSVAFSVVGETGVGKAGDIRITTDSLSLTKSGLLATTGGKGDGGSAIVNATRSISLDNVSAISSGVIDTGQGKSGDVYITTDSLSLKDSSVTTNSFGKGDAGNVIIDARSVSLDNNRGISTSIEEKAQGNGGNIRINTDKLSLSNGAQIRAYTAGQGNAGNVIINAQSISLDGTSSDDSPSLISSNVEQTAQGKGGNIRITTDSLSLTNSAQLLASTSGQGDAGNILINATYSVSVSEANSINGLSSGFLTQTSANSKGKGGDISVNTNVFRLSDGAILNAQTRNDSNGGNIVVGAKLVEVSNGGQILTTTSGSGRAGKITVNATDQVIVTGKNVTFDTRRNNFSDKVVNVGAASGLFVRSQSSGAAGDIEVNSPQIRLDNSGRFIAESALGNGGNINLFVSDLLLLRRGSQISATAGTARQGGDGGNININSKYIIAIPEENSDITANAFQGRGGNVQINSQGIFGIESRPRQTENSDITASSESGVAGVINLITPDNSALQNSLSELPQNSIDTNALIANSCIARTRSNEGTFTITGSGGLPHSPGNPSISLYSTGDVRQVVPNTSTSWKQGDPIVEPTGVYRLADGRLVMSRECL